jgi:hypothetical protein
MAISSNTMFMTGVTYGDMGTAAMGGGDAFLLQIGVVNVNASMNDAAGYSIYYYYIRSSYHIIGYQVGSTASDEASSICVSGQDVIVVGSTMGSMDGNTNFGGYDAFCVKFDDAGGSLY